MKPKRIYVDFHNANKQGHIRLNCQGSIESLLGLDLILEIGDKVVLYDEELEVEGVIDYSIEEQIYVAIINNN
jgi:hypothetical protein